MITLKIMKFYRCIFIWLFVGVSLLQVSSAAPSANIVFKADPRTELLKIMPGSKPDEFRLSPIAGLYEYAHGAEIIYISADGKFVIDGDLFQLGVEPEINLSENRRREARLALIRDWPDTQMLIFGAQGLRHTITVFTDVDCTYCRKLHSEMAKYNALGIRVRYLFFPRTGPKSDSWDKAIAVWCSNNRNETLTRSKKGERIESVKCSNPVQKSYDLGKAMGLQGTPAILTPNGDFIAGYVPPAMLIKRLESIR